MSDVPGDVWLHRIQRQASDLFANSGVRAVARRRNCRWGWLSATSDAGHTQARREWVAWQAEAAGRISYFAGVPRGPRAGRRATAAGRLATLPAGAGGLPGPADPAVLFAGIHRLRVNHPDQRRAGHRAPVAEVSTVLVFPSSAGNCWTPLWFPPRYSHSSHN